MAKKFVFQNNPLLGGPALAEREKSGIPYREIPLAAIERDVNQPRVIFDDEKLQELAASIEKYGVLSPILVKPAKIAGRYLLVAGERRVRAAKLAGLVTIPAIIDQEEDSDDARILSIQLVENLQRSDLTPLERANAISVLKEAHAMSIREVADSLGISKSMVQRSLDLLELPDDLLNALRNGASESKILLLAKIEDEEERAEYLESLDQLTRADIAKQIVGRKPQSLKKVKKEVVRNPEDARIADEIQRSLGLKVKLSRPSNNSESGKLVIDFYSEEDLQELFRKLVS